LSEAGPAASALLELSNVTKRFGGVAALDGVTFSAAKGEILGIIGPNGAGKTTLLNCISGVYRLDGGDIRWEGASIAGMAPHRVARLGIGRTFQVVKPFQSMTVRENAAIGALFGSTEAHLPPRQAFERADQVLELVGLAHKSALPVTALTIPDRKRLEVARAVATNPRLLLLDEVMAGLNHVEVDEALEMVRAVHATGVTIVLIEHVMRVIVGVCDRAIVLHFGQVLAEGEPGQVLRDERVVEAYLGERYARQQRGG
jgi:branched-chain amino acid transport system ATP-binding protein